MRKRPAKPKTVLFFAIIETVAAILFILLGTSAPKWPAVFFLVLTVRLWYLYFKMVSKK